MVSSSFKIVLVEHSGEVEIFSIFGGGSETLDATVSVYPPKSLFWKLNLSGDGFSESRVWG